ncbi:ferritin [Seohaeicola nanhaiensis]|uniref:Ferritin n=1 Tax=Seohaeicola nanhaiensis TaxID=1387282 RepID=A0ABV9KEI3_9RHOB
MADKRLSDKMEKALNAQMTREAFQAQVYLAYASWAEVNGYPGISDFLYKHSVEERQHMFKFLKYINNRGGETKIEALDAPSVAPKDMRDCLQGAFDHELSNSKSIYDLVDMAHEEKDWATFNFLQWFVKEQIEEETLISDLLDRYTLAANKKNEADLYTLDRDTASAMQEATVPREESL